MLYREFQPDILLAPYIETYWTASGYNQEAELHRVLPDGCVDIIFSFEEDALLGMQPTSPNIIGTMTTYLESAYVNKVDMLGMRFKPAGFTAFTRTPISEFTDQRVSLVLVETLFDERFYVELPQKPTTRERIQHLDAYFLEKLKRVFQPEPQIVYAVDLIRQTKGLLPLTEVAYKSCLSLRHLERKFKVAVGTSPKAFSKVVKFQHTVSYLERNKDTSLFHTAIDCGYYDQAHLIKEFKTLSGDSPSYFKL
ncbi:DUF6597 domain-containing transcriptional factor [Bacteroides reticulotermitis]|uniref:DUF6597 domain-containing transcriptional factor n=1 Tax=Bacteroides reticulotermitis TaxID=1133319 RepID=UPI003A840473